MSHSLNTSHPFLWLSMSVPGGIMNIVAVVARLEVMDGFGNVDFHSSRST